MKEKKSKNSKIEFEIKGFLKHSFVNWDGKISSVIWLPKCNFRCPWCYARDLVIDYKKMKNIEIDEIISFLKKDKYTEGIVLTGGEPTLHDLEKLCEKIKKVREMKIKLDTNGTNPKLLRKLLKKKLIDYIAMDIKAPINEYNKINGGINKEIEGKIKESIKIIMRSKIDYEFRTTLIPNFHDEKKIEEIGKMINGAKKWAIQNFKIPSEKNKLIEKSYYNLIPFDEKYFKKLGEIARKYAKEVVMRY